MQTKDFDLEASLMQVTLFINDDKLAQDLSEAILAQNPAPLVQAIPTTEEGVAYLRDVMENAQVPQVVVLDLDFPHQQGPQLLTDIRKDPELRHLNIVGLLQQRNEQEFSSIKAQNLAGVFLKPQDEAGLNHLVETLKSFWHLIELPR